VGSPGRERLPSRSDRKALRERGVLGEQVGNLTTMVDWWGPPEAMTEATMPRPAYIVRSEQGAPLPPCSSAFTLCLQQSMGSLGGRAQTHPQSHARTHAPPHTRRGRHTQTATHAHLHTHFKKDAEGKTHAERGSHGHTHAHTHTYTRTHTHTQVYKFIR
jgi:hypothetical protein